MGSRRRCGPLDPQRLLVEELGGTYREVVGADVGETLVATARSVNATQIVLGATRRSRFAEVTRGSVINRVIRDSGAWSRRPRDQPRIGSRARDARPPRSRRPAALSRRGSSWARPSGWCGPTGADRCAQRIARGSRLVERLAGVLSLVVAVAAIGGLWPALACAVGGSCSSTTTSRHRSTRSRLPRARISSRSSSSSRSRRSSVVRRDLRTSRCGGSRARVEADALGRLAGEESVPILLDTLRRVLRLDGVALLERVTDGWTVLAEGGLLPSRPTRGRVFGCRARGEGARCPGRARQAPTTHESCLPLPRRSSPRSLSVSSARRRRRPGRSRPPVSSEPRSCLPFPTTCARRSLLSRRPPRACFRTTSTGRRRRRDFLETIDEETDRLNARSSGISST